MSIFTLRVLSIELYKRTKKKEKAKQVCFIAGQQRRSVCCCQTKINLEQDCSWLHATCLWFTFILTMLQNMFSWLQYLLENLRKKGIIVEYNSFSQVVFLVPPYLLYKNVPTCIWSLSLSSLLIQGLKYSIVRVVVYYLDFFIFPLDITWSSIFFWDFFFYTCFNPFKRQLYQTSFATHFFENI
jgi:hypothetical protein